MLEIFEILGTVAVDTAQAERSLDRVAGKAGQAEERMVAALEKIGNASEAAFLKVNRLLAQGTDVRGIQDVSMGRGAEMQDSAAVGDSLSAAWGGAAAWFGEQVISPVEELFESAWEYLTFPGALEQVQGAWGQLPAWFDQHVIGPIQLLLDFQWQWPSIPLPHFSIDGEFSLMPPSVPSIGIEWYSRAMDNPLIMDRPTAFGINGNGQIMAGGEAGSEVVSGTDTLMGMISDAVSSRNAKLEAALSGILNLLSEYMPQLASMQLVTDTGALVGAISPMVDSSLGRASMHKGRGN